MLDDRDYMRQPEYRDPAFRRFRLPQFSMMLALILINLVVFILQEILRAYNLEGFRRTFHYFALSNEGLSHGYVWQYLTFQFLHQGQGHFIGNMLGLFFFGRAVEDRIGGKRMILLYLACGVFGGLLQTLLGLVFPDIFGGPVVGASAGVLGLLAVFAAFEPHREILLFFVLPVKIKYVAFAVGAVALFYTLVPAEPGMAHAAHLGGMAMGIFFVRVIMQGGWSRMRGNLRLKKIDSPRASPAGRQKPSLEILPDDVDPILDKISAHGINSLTARERETLEAARKKMVRP